MDILIGKIMTEIKSNFSGIPKPDLTWKEVFDMNLAQYFGENPKFCPECGSKLIQYKSSWEKIENSGQYMVVGIYCPSGDFTFLDCA